MFKVSIYNDPPGSGIGGSENVVALLAEALAKDHEVHLFHHISSLTAKQLAENCGTNLNNVELHYVEPDSAATQVSRRNPWQRYRASQRLHARLSESYDVFIAVVHNAPPSLPRRDGGINRTLPCLTGAVRRCSSLSLKSVLRQPARWLYHRSEWNKRMASVRLISRLTTAASPQTARASLRAPAQRY